MANVYNPSNPYDQNGNPYPVDSGGGRDYGNPQASQSGDSSQPAAPTANIPPPATGAVPPPLPASGATYGTQPVGAQSGALLNNPAAASQFPTTAAGWQSYSGDPTDPNAINAYIQWLTTQPGAIDTLTSDPNYWDQRVTQTGGLTPGNVGYWDTRSTTAGNDAAGAAENAQNGSPSQGDIMSLLSSIFGQGVNGAQTPSQTNPTLTSFLNNLLSDPSSAVNQGLVNSQLVNARDQFEQAKNTNTNSVEAQLASRGLAGSGPEATGLENLTAQLSANEGNDMATVENTASNNANSQILAAVSAATGMSQADAQNLIDQYQATTARGVGAAGALNTSNSNANSLTNILGQLGLENNAQSIGAQEFGDTFGLDQLQALLGAQNGQVSPLLQILQNEFSGANTSAGGFN